MTKFLVRYLKLFTALFLAAIFISCSESAEKIIGKWDNERVIIGGKIQERPEHTKKWIEFNKNGTYTVGNYLHNKTQTGKWSMDPFDSELTLDSDAGPFDDSKWIVNFRDDKMIWTVAPGTASVYIEIIMKKSITK